MNMPSELEAAGLAPPSEERVAPTTKALSFTYTLPSTGEVKDITLQLRLLSWEERCLAARRVAATLNGLAWDSFPSEERDAIVAAHYCAVAFADAPPWFLKAVEEDAVLAIAVYERLQGHRDAYFRRLAEASEDATPGPRLVFRS